MEHARLAETVAVLPTESAAHTVKSMGTATVETAKLAKETNAFRFALRFVHRTQIVSILNLPAPSALPKRGALLPNVNRPVETIPIAPDSAPAAQIVSVLFVSLAVAHLARVMLLAVQDWAVDIAT